MWWGEDLPGLSCLCPKLSLPLLEQRQKPQTVPGLDVELCGGSTQGANSVLFCVVKLGPTDRKLCDPPGPACPAFLTLYLLVLWPPRGLVSLDSCASG